MSPFPDAEEIKGNYWRLKNRTLHLSITLRLVSPLWESRVQKEHAGQRENRLTRGNVTRS